MPQLSPLNWIFLFLLFWMAVLGLSIILWWTKKVYFEAESLGSRSSKENKWNW
uniref:ATP synthase complex subunit 8 n=1 Tax=Struthiolaria papulosa TaxID=2821810 RepID=A0A8A6KFM7_9CAEN|nr:ATP synthase F0 subunit 8 [Struthiolaria papulosa]QTI82417.1 ATP synthase F0 subunit 8 [Struthiolaria papulosa]